jgi:hypothetical protein
VAGCGILATSNLDCERLPSIGQANPAIPALANWAPFNLDYAELLEEGAGALYTHEVDSSNCFPKFIQRHFFLDQEVLKNADLGLVRSEEVHAIQQCYLGYDSVMFKSTHVLRFCPAVIVHMQ